MNKPKIALIIVFIIWLLLLCFCHFWSLSNGQKGFSPVVIGGDDGVRYYAHALKILSENQEPKNIYSALIAIIANATGIKSVLFFKTINFCVTYLSIILVYSIYTYLVFEDALINIPVMDQKKQQILGNQCLILIIGTAFYPSYILFSFPWTLLRDGWIFFLYLLTIYFIMKIYNEKQSKNFALLLIQFFITIIILYSFRFYIAITLCISIVLYFVIHWDYVKNAKKNTRIFAVIMTITCIVLGIIGTWYKMGGKFYNYATYRNKYFQQNSGSNLGLKIGDREVFSILVTTNIESPQIAGKIIQFKAKCYNVITNKNDDNHEYQYLIQKIKDESAYPIEILRDYSIEPNCSWDTTDYLGTYLVKINARRIGSKDTFSLRRKISFDILKNTQLASAANLPVSSFLADVTLNTNFEAPQPAGRIIKIIANVSDNEYDLEFAFLIGKEFINKRKNFKIVQQYSSDNIYYWDTNNYSGKCYLKVYVRRKGTNYLYELTEQIPYRIKSISSKLSTHSISKSSIKKYTTMYTYSFINNVFGPLPNRISNLKSFFSFLEGLIIFTIFFYILINIKYLSRLSKLLAIQSVVWFATISYFNDNIGTAMRLRVPGVLLLIILFCYIRWKKTVNLL